MHNMNYILLTENHKRIISDLLNDNRSIWQEVKSNLNGLANEYAHEILRRCIELYSNCVENEYVKSINHVQIKLTSLLTLIAGYRNLCNDNTLSYKFLNSLFDRTAEAFNDLMNN